VRNPHDWEVKLERWRGRVLAWLGASAETAPAHTP
jgi:hypothetical protein